MLLALIVGGAFAGEPVLGPAGWTWLGPLPPDDAAEGAGRDEGVARDEVVLDPRTCAVEVRRVDLDGGPEYRDVRLARVWADGEWRWADDWRVEGGRLLRPGRLPAALDGARFGEDVLRVDGAGRVIARVRAGRTVEILRDPAGAFVGMRSGPVEVRVDGDRGVASDGREVRWRRERGELRSVADAGGVVSAYGYAGGALARVTWADGSAVAIEAQARGTRTQGVGGGWRCERPSTTRTTLEGPGGSWFFACPATPGDGAEAVTDPTGATTRATWAGGRLVGWTDPRGGETRLTRDARGRVTRVDEPSGAAWSLGWDEVGLARLTAPDGGAWTLGRNAAGGVTRVDEPSGRSAAFERDAAGRLRGVRVGSSGWAVLRDPAGRATALLDPVGSRVDLVRGPDGTVGTVRDAGGGTWTIGRDVRGLVTTVADPGQGAWTVERDALGRPVAVTDPTGARTRWTLRDDGLPGRVVVAGRHAWDLLWSAAGALSGIRDPLGRATGFPRDGLGRARAVHRADGGAFALARDPAGEIVGVGRLTIRRDAVGRPLGVTGLVAGDLAWDRDLAGRVVGVSGPGVGLALAREAGGAVRTVQIRGSAPITLVRDAQGRVVRAEGPRGTTLVRDAAGRVTSVGSAGRPTLRLDRDVRGLVGRAVLSVAKGSPLVWAFGRDAVGRVVRVEGPRGARLGVDRDAAGRPTLARLSAGALARFTYDGDGVTVAVTDRTDAVRARAAWTYGPTGAVDRLDAGVVWLLRRDPLGALVAAESTEAVWSSAPDGIEGPDGAYVRYDDDGRPIAARSAPGESDAWGLGAGDLRYVVGPEGAVTTIEGPRGVVELAYDGVGRLVSWSGPGGAWRVDRDADGTIDVRGTALGWGVPLRVAGSPVAAVAGVGAAEPDAGAILGPWGTPLVAAAATAEGLFARLLPWSPSGDATSDLPGAGASGRFPLGKGARIGLLDAIDPVTGASLGPGVRWPWQRPAWEADPGASPWPDPDGAAHVAWDDAAWAPASPWADPLALLVAAGDLPDGGPRAARAPGLPWLPASLAPAIPAPVPDPFALDTAEDAVVAWIVGLARAPTSAAAPSDLTRMFVGDEVARWLDVPPGLAPALPPELGGG